jgi:hypothetical protein
MIFVPYRSLLDLARELESGGGRRSDPPRNAESAEDAPSGVLAVLRRIARRPVPPSAPRSDQSAQPLRAP